MRHLEVLHARLIIPERRDPPGQEPLRPREADRPFQPSSFSEIRAWSSPCITSLPRPQTVQRGGIETPSTHLPGMGCWAPRAVCTHFLLCNGQARHIQPRGSDLFLSGYPLMPHHVETRFRPGRRGAARQRPCADRTGQACLVGREPPAPVGRV